jgi:2-amino-4-hydroxy-6-hydroxymethyldihydropteridine diphosphokinase
MTTLEDRIAVVALGSNQDFGQFSPKEILFQAIDCLATLGLQLMGVSRLYHTPCFPAGAGPDYVNSAAALVVPAAMTAPQLLAALHQVEAQFGRARTTRWAGRTLDLDLIAFGEEVAPDLAGFRHWQQLPPEAQSKLAPAELILPHPRLQDRAFVLVPMADVAPDWRHPVLGLTVVQMLAALPDAARAEVVAAASDASV